MAARHIGRASLVAVMLAGVSAAVLAQAPAGAKPAVGNAVSGQQLYTKMACFYCHGTEGQGSAPGIGPRIAQVPRGFESFVRYVRRPTGRMTGYSEKILTDADLADIYAYLRSLPAARAVSDIPLLEQLRKP